MKNKIKNIVRVIILIPLLTYLLYCCFYFIDNDFNPTYKDCGKVISKSTDEVAVKHGIMTELYLNIQFDKSGFRSIECTPTTFFSKKTGDNVCFSIRKKTSIWHMVNCIIAIMVYTALILFSTVVIIMYIFLID